MPDDPKATFRTHQNYLQAMAMVAGKQLMQPDSAGLAQFALRVTSARQFARLQRNRGVDFARVQGSLRNAWGSELLIALGDRYIQEDEVVRISNNWNVVMAYYAAFHGTHALLAAQEQPAPPDHAKLQNQFVAAWTQRTLDLAPFTLGLKSQTWLNLPTGTVIDDTLHPWSSCTQHSCMSIAAKAFKSTRTDKISDAQKRAREQKVRDRNRVWREENEKRKISGKRALKRDFTRGVTLNPLEKASIESALRPTSYLDYLYRLRIRSNYEDSAMFTDGPENDIESSSVRARLAYLTSCFSLMTELHVRQLVGRQWLETEASTWCAANIPNGKPVGLGARLQLLFP